MKKLIYLMLLVLFIQCKTEEAKDTCGIVTEKVTLPKSDATTNESTASISYASCEYIVIMPQSKDSFEVQRYLKDNGFTRQKGTKYNDSPLTLYSRSSPISTDGPTPPPKGPPPPPIKDYLIINTIVYNTDLSPVKLIDLMYNINSLQKR
jgi:hypothetical protein